MILTLLYRGPLASCNYACPYCPFAKRREGAAEHAADARALSRFVEWVGKRQDQRLSLFFTPWGEAPIHRRYQDALVRLSAMAHVDKVAIQTNLSCALGWVERCDRRKLGLWCTYHPGQVGRDRFLARCHALDRLAVPYSVGVVGMREHLAEIEGLRRALRPEVYLWVNAFKRAPEYYTAEDVARLTAVDPLFPLNNTRHPSLGRACRTGHTVIAVDGEGTLRRCHFVKEPLGNLYRDDLPAILRPSPCPNETCACHIGYVHLEHLGLAERFGDGLLERRIALTPCPSPAAGEGSPSRAGSPSPVAGEGAGGMRAMHAAGEGSPSRASSPSPAAGEGSSSRSGSPSPVAGEAAGG